MKKQNSDWRSEGESQFLPHQKPKTRPFPVEVDAPLAVSRLKHCDFVRRPRLKRSVKRSWGVESPLVREVQAGRIAFV